MHAAAFEFVGRHAIREPISVIEIGSRDLNGSVRPHFPAANWVGIDVIAGPAVDVVIDAMVYKPAHQVDLVICCEVFEHEPRWKDIIARAFTWLKPGGQIIITCGGIGREPHSAIDGAKLRPGEWYQNISEQRLRMNLEFAGFYGIITEDNAHALDTYAVAYKPGSLRVDAGSGAGII